MNYTKYHSSVLTYIENSKGLFTRLHKGGASVTLIHYTGCLIYFQKYE